MHKKQWAELVSPPRIRRCDKVWNFLFNQSQEPGVAPAAYGAKPTFIGLISASESPVAPALTRRFQDG
jgi:hypothetical protein